MQFFETKRVSMTITAPCDIARFNTCMQHRDVSQPSFEPLIAQQASLHSPVEARFRRSRHQIGACRIARVFRLSNLASSIQACTLRTQLSACGIESGRLPSHGLILLILRILSSSANLRRVDERDQEGLPRVHSPPGPVPSFQISPGHHSGKR